MTEAAQDMFYSTNGSFANSTRASVMKDWMFQEPEPPNPSSISLYHGCSSLRTQLRYLPELTSLEFLLC